MVCGAGAREEAVFSHERGKRVKTNLVIALWWQARHATSPSERRTCRLLNPGKCSRHGCRYRKCVPKAMPGRIALRKHFLPHLADSAKFIANVSALRNRPRMRSWARPRCRPRRRRRRNRWCRRRGRTRSYTWRHSGSRCSCGCWCRSAALAWGLDFNRHRRAGLKVSYCRVGSLWRLIGIEPEII